MNKTIPIIDFQPFLDGNLQEQEFVAQQFYDSLADVGALYLKNYGFSPDLVAQAFAQSRTFFDLPLEDKEKIAMKPMKPGYEKAKDEEGKDFREVFHYGPEVNKNNWINQWPTSLPQFRDTSIQLFQECQSLSKHLFQAQAMALKVPETTFIDVLSDGNCYSFLAHYLPLTEPIKRNQTRAKPHYGSGTFGLIFQDDGKGLKICPHEGEWIDVDPIPGTVVIIMEDLIQRWTNDKLYSTFHQVSIPEEDFYKARSRYSIAFKVTPNDDAIIRCVETCITEDNPCKYPPISVDDYYKEWDAKHHNIYSEKK
ncbi:isopenicillin N synthase family dioxygenase [Crocosphaera sp. XPORK-15E]|uniref:isopenicillin N synthase family dioxygenase n=1 Tax=Crocosphaera sp. XPORK-15E TaxID=3110247 RepID=UPI002B1FB0EF|nr:2-oxoglutarate and iron-dependent oxygenase domain-containing protein [Crocosphaera sp. XPORK-15E]MEA5536931.1 2-oxoglutarate and iron-dependent oxygenase domain-containing protein [Crocosphaera sp. XPORK-15E]